jgi:AraC-like DNA-binding protein
MITMNTEPSNCQQLTASPVAPAAWPAMPTICSVEMFAATIEMPISGQVSPRPARKKVAAVGRMAARPPALPHAQANHGDKKPDEDRADPFSPWTIFWIHFRGAQAADHLANLGVSAARPVVPVDDPGVLLAAFEDTIRHANRGFGEAALTGLSTAFARLLGLAKVHQVAVGARSRNAENRLLKVLAMMREDVARPWTLEELARQANLSPPHFTALCRRQTGMPPLGLLIRLRLQRAMDLLQRGNHNVAEAARAVGYEDPFYFSRLFKKHIGVTPSSCMHGP